MQPQEQALELSKVAIAPIKSKGCLSRFCCTEHGIDKWAKDKAHKWHDAGRARVFVARLSDGVYGIGFYSVSLTHQKQEKLQQDQRDKWKDGAPLFYLDWVATHKPFQQMGLGTHMLLDALGRASLVSDTVPIYGVALRSLNDQTTKFYSSLGFRQAPDEGHNPLMILPIWTIKDLFA